MDRTSILYLLPSVDDFCKEAVLQRHLRRPGQGPAVDHQCCSQEEPDAVVSEPGRLDAPSAGGRWRAEAQAAGRPQSAPARLHRKDLERRLSDNLGTRVRIDAGRKKGSGRLTIAFYSLDQFDGLMDRLGFRST
jgi:hypothetical protein